MTNLPAPLPRRTLALLLAGRSAVCLPLPSWLKSAPACSPEKSSMPPAQPFPKWKSRSIEQASGSTQPFAPMKKGFTAPLHFSQAPIAWKSGPPASIRVVRKNITIEVAQTSRRRFCPPGRPAEPDDRDLGRYSRRRDPIVQPRSTGQSQDDRQSPHAESGRHVAGESFARRRHDLQRRRRGKLPGLFGSRRTRPQSGFHARWRECDQCSRRYPAPAADQPAA